MADRLFIESPRKAGKTVLVCAECGNPFQPRKAWQAFCSSRCQTRHRDLLASRGKVALPFVLAMRTGKRGRTDDSAYALQQLSALADLWLAEDKAVGRDCMAIVRRKRRDGWQACDVG